MSARESVAERIRKLREEIDRQRYRYHVLDRSEISDAALDSLKHELAQLEAQHPQLITPDSPTQRVGGRALPQFAQVVHRRRMLSLTDAFARDELADWQKRNKKILPADFDYWLEPKIDGVAVSLIYQDGVFTQGATRGDGTMGEDVTQNLKTIEAIPLRLRHPHAGRLEVRGEVYMLKKDFAAMNRKRAREGKPLFANPRNVSAGSIRQLDPAVTAARPLRFFAWEITEGVERRTRQEEHTLLTKLGFPVPPDGKLARTLDELEKYLVVEEKRRERLPFQVDGVVIKINNLEQARRLGVVGKTPRAAIAFKFAAEEATTVVEEIVVQVGRTGSLTPVAHLRPVAVAGTTVSRATLHNADEVARKDVRVGDTVIIRKAGDIIPEVVRVLPNLRPAQTKPFRRPSRCPMCGGPVKQDPDGVVVRCRNPDCFAQQRERILHAVSREAFDIEGLGGKIVDQLYREGLIKDAADLWQLTVGDLLPLERFADTSAGKLIEEIQSHKRVPLARFLVALGIPHIGVVTAQDLACEWRTLDKFLAAEQPELMGIEGIGDKVAQEVSEFLARPSTKQLIKKYKKAGIVVAPAITAGPLRGKTFAFTGSMADLTREEAKQRVQALGGKVAAAVGREVDYVVVGEEPGSKARKAKELGVKMLTPGEFQRMLKV